MSRPRFVYLSGGFLKTDELHNDRPVYYFDKDKTWIFHNKVKNRWEVGKEVSDTATAIGFSVESRCYSPELCLWEQGVTVSAGDPDTPVLSVTPQDGFYDEEFPHNNSSISTDEEYLKKVEAEWISARDPILCDSPVLFDGVAPSDVLQGGIGDCWLVAAIACVCEFPGYVQKHLFQTKELTDDGKYEIWLYQWWAKEWKLLVIDDFIACKPRRSWWETKASPRFAQLPDGQIYVNLLEKAFAKFSFNYHNLRGGHGILALVAMTGETDCILYRRNKHLPQWEVTSDVLVVRSDKGASSEKVGELQKGTKFEEIRRDGKFVHFRKLEGEGPEDGWVCVRVGGKKVAKSVQVGDGVHWLANALVFPENWDGHWQWGFGTKLPNESNDGLWEKLVEYDLKNYLFVCHWFMSEKEKDLNEKYNIAEGLVCGHEYSILGAREVCGERLVCIRNPWGRGCDWQGPWSDQSEEWEANPEVAKALDYKNLSDGKFWMDFDDFCRCWSRVFVCRKEMPVGRDSFETERQKHKDASREAEECYIVVAGGAVKGSFTDLEEAKAVLNEYPSQAPQPFRMVCAAQYGKVQDDPHTVAGQNQGAGVAAGFNKSWWGWPDIRKMNKIAQDYLLQQAV